MTNAHFERIDQYRDIESVNHHAEALAHGLATEEVVLAGLRTMSRDNARTPVQWDASRHAGFTTGEPWIEVNPNHVTVNAAAQRDDPRSVLHHYRRLIELRHTEPAVALGDFAMLAPHDEAVYAFTRRLGGTELLVLGNFTGAEQAVPVGEAVTTAWADAELVLHNAGADDDAGPARGVAVPLGPWEARVYRRRIR